MAKLLLSSSSRQRRLRDSANLLDLIGMSYEDLLPLLSRLKKHELAEIDALLLSPSNKIEWMPQPGPQTKAFFSKAQMLGYGGAGGGGKTDLLFGKAYYHHHRSIIFRREYTQFQPIIDRGLELFGQQGEKGAYYNGASKSWRFPREVPSGKAIFLGAVSTALAHTKFQGHPHDLKAFDELPHFTRTQFDYLRGWLRSVVLRRKAWQIVATMNPPNSPEERWVLQYWEPWLDKRKYPGSKRAKPGDLLYFITDNDKQILVDGPGRHLYKGKWRRAMSRTFIFSKVKDNMFLRDSPYEDVLDSLPEPFRSRLKDGDFDAGIQDGDNQLIPSAWLHAAQARWRARKEPDTPTNQLGFDVSRGGRDRTVATPRKGNYFCKQIERPGKLITDGQKAAQLVITLVQPKTLICVDAIGVGTSAFDFLKEMHDPNLVIPMIGSAATQYTDRSGYLGFVNARSAWYWKLRESLDPALSTDELAIPDDPELEEELLAITWKPTYRGIQVCSKDEIIDALGGRSPDKADSLVYSHAEPEMPGRGIFEWMRSEHDKVQAEREAERERERLARA